MYLHHLTIFLQFDLMLHSLVSSTYMTLLRFIFQLCLPCAQGTFGKNTPSVKCNVLNFMLIKKIKK